VKESGIAILAIAGIGILLSAADASARGAVEGPIIYVESQGLYYDSIVTAMELPPKGPFQQLDPGHRGGRWWMDENGSGDMDDGDVYFSCPLLGPGRDEP
jgi:hypothetical protein